MVAAVGGIFHQSADAQQAADTLVRTGVDPGSIRFTELPDSVSDALVQLGIPAEAVEAYERNVVPGDILLTVNSEAVPPVAIANEIGRLGGLVVEFGWAPSGSPGER
jgi:hypothetical protein